MSADSKTLRPTALPVNFDGIPDDLKELQHFVLWRYEDVNGKWTKVPYQALKPNLKASVNDPKTWASFDEVRAAYDRGGFDGIGTVLVPDDDLCGIDLDHCVDPLTGEPNPEAASIIEVLASYTTLSPSGEGVRIFARGCLPSGGRKKGNVEMYESGRYLTLTGRLLSAERSIEARQTQLEDIHRKVFGKDRKSAYSATTPAVATSIDMRLDDAKLLEKMFSSAKNGAAIKQLFNGDTSGYGGDASSADFALIAHLLWWCNYDSARADDLFRRSKLMRQKWDDPHSSDGLTYGQMTLAKGCEGKGQDDGYRSDPSSRSKGSPDDEAEEGEVDLLGYFKTDYGNAERIHALHGPKFRYSHALGWLVWDGKRWRVSEEETKLIRFAQQTARETQSQALKIEGSERESMLKHALSWEHRTRLVNSVALLKSIPGVHVDVSELDTNPMLLNVENGTVDLQAGTLRPHDPSDLITKLAPVTFDAKAVCPLWDEFQETICGNDRDLIAFKQRAYGYSATGKTSEDALFIAYGTGANGKSTEQNIILQLLGTYAKTAQFDTFAVKKNESVRNDIADLVGSRFVSASEGESRQRLAEGLVKQMTGGDILKARFLHKEYFEFKPAFKLWLATNYKPGIRGTDTGIWRRIKLIPYAVTIPPEKRDKELREKLEGELSGILNWLLKGCVDWVKHGLGDAEAVNAATAGYRQESDALADFIAACCSIDEVVTEIAGDLYRAYKIFCDENDEQPFSAQLFGRMLTERGYLGATERIGKKTAKVRKGICLRDEMRDQYVRKGEN